jgi:transcriptional regulator with XRE-family HTH domain
MNHEYFCDCLGAIIKAARIKKGISQYALADAAGVGRRYIQRIENGHQEAALSTLFDLARALAISPMLLVGELEYAMRNGHLPESVHEVLPPKKLGRPERIR